MSSPETASVAKPSLAQDWLDALGYWLRGRRGVAALIVSAVLTGAALNWSWLVAAGVVPLLLTVLPCLAMCGLGLCMSKMGGGVCSKPSNGTGDSAERWRARRCSQTSPDRRKVSTSRIGRALR
jgi:hypothetical protein